MRVWSRLAEMMAEQGSAALVTIVDARGSTPREAGARILVQPDGRFSGTIGGGTLEWRAIALAQAALADPQAKAFDRQSFSLGPELGQCCGGRVELAIERFGWDRMAEVNYFATFERGGPFATEGRLAEGKLTREIIDTPVTVGSAAWREGVLLEGFGETARPVYLFGAGHVGRAIVFAAAPLPFAFTWLDPRPDAFPKYVPTNAELRRFDDARVALGDAPDGAFVLVMTHSHGLDLGIVHAALGDPRFPFVGLIGSATKRARFEKRLGEAGIPRERIDELACPIGVAGIKSKVPAIIAASVVAEMLIRDEALRGGLAVDEPAGELESALAGSHR